MKKTLLFTGLALLLALGLALSFSPLHGGDEKKQEKKQEKAQLGKKAPDFTLKGVDGKEHSLPKDKIVVLEWNNFGCPFVKKHYKSKNMQKLQKKYTKKGVVWYTICSSAKGKQGHYPQKVLEKKLKKQGINSSAFLLDYSGKVGHLYGAKTTPHMYIINKKGELVYNGAIDNKRSVRLSSVKKAKNYIVPILDALLKGEKVEPTGTTPYGCSVKYAK